MILLQQGRQSAKCELLCLDGCGSESGAGGTPASQEADAVLARQRSLHRLRGLLNDSGGIADPTTTGQQ